MIAPPEPAKKRPRCEDGSQAIDSAVSRRLGEDTPTAATSEAMVRTSCAAEMEFSGTTVAMSVPSVRSSFAALS